MFAYFSKLKKILTWTLLVFFLATTFLTGLVNPQVAKAVDFTDSYITGTGGKTGPATELDHFFKVNGTQYKTIYTHTFEIQPSQNTEKWAIENGNCFKLASSNYSATQGNYYFCTGYITTEKSYQGIFAEAPKSDAEKTYHVNNAGKSYISLQYDDWLNKYLIVTDSKEYEYLKYVAKTEIEISTIKPPGTKDCSELYKNPGKDYTAEEYFTCFFPGYANNFDDVIKDNGGKSFTITISGHKFTSADSCSPYCDGLERPEIIFTLKNTLANGTSTYFYFVATNPSYPNLTFRFQCTDSVGPAFTLGDSKSLSDDGDFSPGKAPEGYQRYRPEVRVPSDSWDAFLKKVLKDNTGGCNPENLNTDTLTKAGVTQETRAESGSTSQCEKKFDCENPTIFSPFRGTICKAQCAVIDFTTSAIAWVIREILYPSLGLTDIGNEYKDPNTK